MRCGLRESMALAQRKPQDAGADGVNRSAPLNRSVTSVASPLSTLTLFHPPAWAPCYLSSPFSLLSTQASTSLFPLKCDLHGQSLLAKFPPSLAQWLYSFIKSPQLTSLHPLPSKQWQHQPDRSSRLCLVGVWITGSCPASWSPACLSSPFPLILLTPSIQL